MATVSFDVSERSLAEFNARFPPEAREKILKIAFDSLLQDDPRSALAFAEDDRRYEDTRAGRGVPHERVAPWLDALARGERPPCPK